MKSANELDYAELTKFLILHDCIESDKVDLPLVISNAHPELVDEFVLLFDPSHVFVCNTSVCDLACDAFLCPVAWIDAVSRGLTGAIWHQWQEHTKEKNSDLWDYLVSGNSNGCIEFECISELVAVPKKWPNNSSQPLILPTRVVFWGDDQIECLMESARMFLEVAYCRVGKTSRLNGRERPLFALPILVTGDSGASYRENLLRVVEAFVSKHRVDCVIVAADDATYAHAQSKRQEPAPILNSEKVKAAKDLSDIATAEELTLF